MAEILRCRRPRAFQGSACRGSSRASCLQGSAANQTLPKLSLCAEPKAPACAAVSGERSEGWKLQTRSEVMAQHGMVATSQPLASEAGIHPSLKPGVTTAPAPIIAKTKPSAGEIQNCHSTDTGHFDWDIPVPNSAYGELATWAAAKAMAEFDPSPPRTQCARVN